MTWAWGSFAHRETELEERDKPSLSDSDLSQILSFQQFQGRFLGGYAPILNFFRTAQVLWPAGVPISILDVRCGAGGLSRAIVAWAKENGVDVQILGIDSRDTIIRTAKEQCKKLKNIVFDVRELSDASFLQAQQFDYVVSNAGLHHRPEEKLEHDLITMNRLAKRGVAMTDFLRDMRGAFWMNLLAGVTRNKVVRRDVVLAMKKGFTVNEMKAWCEKAGMRYVDVRLELGYRFSLLGERAMVLSGAMERAPGLAGA
jgi:ubiquinone/menaquinone biosynthesis C-methylase UbiE